MAEGIANNLYGDKIKALSAGSNPAGFVHPMAIEVMKEIGIDISSYKSKPVEDIDINQMDYVITLCGDENEPCPILPASVKRLHWDLKDPAKAEGSYDEKLAFFKKIRNEIKHRIENLLEV